MDSSGIQNSGFKNYSHQETTGIKSKHMTVVGDNYVKVIVNSSAEIKSKVASFRIIDDPITNFVGREDLIDKLHLLLKSCSTKPGCLERTVIIYGLGGMGKSELARKYVQRHLQDPIIKNVAWIDSETKTSLENTFNAIARTFEVNTENRSTEEITAGVYNHYSENCHSGLFIFDNVDQLRDEEPYVGIIKYLPMQNLERRPLILITSRINDWEAPAGRDNTVGITELSQDHSVQLLTAQLNLKENQKLDPKIQAAIQKLAQVIKGYPLGLTLAASNIRCNALGDIPQKIKQYIKKFNIPKSGWLDDKLSPRFECKYNRVMSNVWQTTLNKIKSMGLPGKCALTLLNILAFLPTDDIRKSSVDAILESGFLELKGVDGYSILEMFSLISVINGPKNDYLVRIHRHIQRCARESLDLIGNKSYLLLIGLFLCQTEQFKNAEKFKLQVHRNLKQRNWPNNSLCMSVVFLSRCISDVHAYELAADLYDVKQLKEKTSARCHRKCLNTIIDLCLYVLSERVDRRQICDKRQFDSYKNNKNSCIVTIDMYIAYLLQSNSTNILEMCTEACKRITDIWEHVVNSIHCFNEVIWMQLGESLTKALKEVLFGPQHAATISSIYQVLSAFYLDSKDHNVPLYLHTALQAHFQFHTNDNSLKQNDYWKNGPLKYQQIMTRLTDLQNKQNSSKATEMENCIIHTFLDNGGPQVVTQHLGYYSIFESDSAILEFIFMFTSIYNCSDMFKETPSFLNSLLRATTSVFLDTSEYSVGCSFLVLWFALFSDNRVFKDTNGREWSLYSVDNEMNIFLNNSWIQNENQRMELKIPDELVISTLGPYLAMADPDMLDTLHFLTAVALIEISMNNQDWLASQELPFLYDTLFKTRRNLRFP